VAEVLSQSEIEALLAAMTTVEDDSAANPAVEERLAISSTPSSSQLKMADGKVFLPLRKRRHVEVSQQLADPRLRFGPGPLSYEPYDFRRPDKLSKEHLRSLQLLHESFASYFAGSLAGYLRAQVQIEVVSVEQVPYDEYMRSISASLLNILNVSPLSGQIIFETDFGILFSMIDRLLGGTGAAGKIVRDLTDIEKMLAENIVHHALDDLRTAWETVNPLEFDVASTETSSQFVQIVPGNDTVVLILFEVRMGDYQGAMSLCIPYLLIKPILGKLSAQRWFSMSKKREANFGAQLAKRLNTTRVPCVARLGKIKTTAGGVMDLKVGDVVSMQVAEDPDTGQAVGKLGTVDIVIGNRVKFRGKTGLRGKRLAVSIETVVPPPLELISHKETN
jgi:flagellar motor switch protein FliM